MAEFKNGDPAIYIGPCTKYFNSPVTVISDLYRTSNCIGADGKLLPSIAVHRIRAFDGYDGKPSSAWVAEPHELKKPPSIEADKELTKELEHV